MLDSNDVGSLDFVAPDQQTFDYWVDGINALLGKGSGCTFILCVSKLNVYR